jgi:Helicase HerA, central domain
VSRDLYLGRETESNEQLNLNPDDFVTHGVILGMTGSGKTGLALGLLEEMIEAGVPVIAIDPKGDLPNLALLFPDFQVSDFETWTDPNEAKREGLTLQELASKKAELWKNGLAKWDITPDQIRQVRDKLDLRILTPGSKAVNPVNLLGTFQPPVPSLPPEDQADLASGIVSGLLSLVMDNVDPLRDPRHVLLVQILSNAWSENRGLTLEDLIGQLVDPPFAKVGVFPVDTFYSPDDRMKLAMQLNNLVASPTFGAWKEGLPLNIASLMSGEGGKTPVNIFSLAHLSEKERHFFVGRLMNEVLTWTRSLSGSSSLRGFIYFDEVAGYLPPHPHNPPSKKPILTMLKQSRAVGVGVCLATQNPVDLDYKALSNMGTWMIGRLQTEQDRNRVRDGLISASGGLTAKEVEAEFSKIQPRTFLLKKPKADKPVLFKTRWAMSYLRGPITLAELPKIANRPALSSRETPGPADSPSSNAEGGKETPPPTPKGFGQSFMDPRFVFHNRLKGFFEEHQEASREDAKILHRPALLAVLRLKFDERKDDFVMHQRHHFVAFPIDGVGSVASKFETVALEDDDLMRTPLDRSLFTELPQEFDEEHELKQAQQDLVDHLYRTLSATRFVNSHVKLYSRPNEDKESFLARCSEGAEQMADEAAVKLRKKLETKIERASKKLDRTKDKVERLALSEKGKKLEGVWRAGEMLLSLFSKRRKSFGTVLGSSRRALEADTRTKQAEDELQTLQAELLELQNDLEAQIEDLEAEHAELADKIEEKEIRLNKSDIEVERFEILWIPVSKRL